MISLDKIYTFCVKLIFYEGKFLLSDFTYKGGKFRMYIWCNDRGLICTINIY